MHCRLPDHAEDGAAATDVASAARRVTTAVLITEATRPTVPSMF